MKPPPAQIVAIQYLRALAALAVLMFHACQWEWVNFEVGAAGVDLFFIVSGFILWTVTAGREVSPLTFLKRRAARVVPLYWVATFAALAIVAIRPGAIAHVEGEPLHVVLSLLFIPHADPRGVPFPVLDVGWTLTYEAFFYLIFAVGLMLDEAERAWFVTLAMTGTVLFGIAVPPFYLYGANLLLLEFVAGIWLARAWRAGRLPGAATSWALIVAGLGAIAVQHLMGFKSDLWRPFFWGVPALAVAAGALGLERAVRLPRWPWLAKLGDASYSIYLSHTITAPIVAWAIGFQKPWLLIPLVFALGIITGLATRRFIEEPLLRLFGALPARPRMRDRLDESAAP